MRWGASCPGCGARFEFDRAPVVVCPSCRVSSMVIVPEGDAGEGLCEVELVRQTPSSRRLPRPLWALLIGIVSLAGLAFLLLVLGGIAGQGSGTVRTWAYEALQSLVSLPFGIAFALPITWLLFRLPRGARAFWRSTLAIALGVAAIDVVYDLVTAGFVAAGASRSLRVAPAMILAGLAAGWLTVRIGRAQPFRHTLGVAALYALGWLAVAPSRGWEPAYFGCLACLPLLFAGAALAARTTLAPSAAR